ncbi:hypothetical protein GGQ97_000352 [Sphingomonas kaistensis]|uniref:Lipoprotein n=1 Tax=Sphingomonas kaistensis TaxID=298708 RepID=A0A7X5Y3L4_9SPHN|nr:hypothetical protein [Sphingomonas kaistensis]NJC04559.1 hypothetical protein [Sphingomonas kaistensis]
MRFLPVLLFAPALTACAVASTAVDVVTLPVKVVSKGVDLATTSQSEADEKRGREIRKEEERLGRERRELEARCRNSRARPDDLCPPR